MKISTISVKNFKSFKDLLIDNLSNLSVLIGQNGVGKSNFMDIFVFLSECVRIGDIGAIVDRIGVDKLTYNGDTSTPTEISVTWKENKLRTIQYSIRINYINGHCIIEDEQILISETKGGKAIITCKMHNKRGACKLCDTDENIGNVDIALSIFGRIKEHKEIGAVYNFLKGISSFNLDLTALHTVNQKEINSLSYRGYNLRLVAFNMQEHYPERFQAVIEHMECALGITEIQLSPKDDGEINLVFKLGKEVICESEISDGMLSIFAYYIVLEQSVKSSLLCIEEPEKNINHTNLLQLAEVMRIKPNRSNLQIFV